MTRELPDERLSAWLDGELTDAEAAALEDELARNPELRAQADELEAVTKLIRDDGPLSAPDGFHASVMARVELEDPKPAWWEWFRRPLGVPLEGWGVALAAAAVLVVALPSFRGGAEDPGPATATPRTDKVLERKAEPVAPVPTKGVAAVPVEGGDASVVPSEPMPPPRPNAATSGGGKPKPSPVSTTVQGTAEVGPVPTAEAGVVVPAPAAASAGPIGPFRQVPYSYDLYVQDEASKLELLRMVGAYRGETRDAKGEVVRSSGMASNEEVLFVSLPQAMLADFGGELGSLGQVVTQADGGLVSGDQVDVRVTLHLVGGAPKAAAPPANATRAAAQQDEVSESR